MKNLIINADDLGADEARNRGIFEAIEAGRVTSVSVLVNGDGFEDAMERWERLGITEISLGIHINLSEGKPVSKDLRMLTAKDGFFRGKQATHTLLNQPSRIELEREIQKEINAQIQVLAKFKIPITHLDGHQHIHITPVVLPIVLSEALNNKIRWIRIPDEPHPSLRTIMTQPDVQEEPFMFSKLGTNARSIVMSSEIDSCDHFRGLYLKDKFDIVLLEEVFKNLPIGLTELMVHPGRVADTVSSSTFSAFSTLKRENELNALLDPVFPSLIEKYGISLTPFPESLE